MKGQTILSFIYSHTEEFVHVNPAMIQKKESLNLSNRGFLVTRMIPALWRQRWVTWLNQGSVQLINISRLFTIE